MTKNLLEPNPFSKPILAPKGNRTARDIYTAVGFALDRWERCETSFGTLYSSLIDTKGGTWILMRSFGTLTSSNARRQMILHAANAFFWMNKNDDLQKEVRRCLTLYEDAAARRSEIAHAVVDGKSRHKVENNRAIPLPTIWFLVPPIFATRKNELEAGKKPTYRYSTVEISHFTSSFEELGSRVGNLAREIRSFRASLPEKL